MIGGLMAGLGLGLSGGYTIMLLANRRRGVERAKERIERQSRALKMRELLIDPTEVTQKNFGPYALARNAALCHELGIGYDELCAWDREHGVSTLLFTDAQMTNKLKLRV